MKSTLAPVTSLLIGVGFLITGHGLELTPIPLRAAPDGWTASEIGAIGWAYYVGFVAGCIGSPAIIKIAEFDRLVDEAAVEPDFDRTLELYTEAERLLVQEQAGTIPIYWYADNALTKPYLRRVQAPSLNREFWKWTIAN